MTIDEVEKYYGSAWKMERKHKLSHKNISNWKRLGYVPILTQIKIEKLTGGVLKANLEHCPKDGGAAVEQLKSGE